MLQNYTVWTEIQGPYSGARESLPKISGYLFSWNVEILSFPVEFGNITSCKTLLHLAVVFDFVRVVTLSRLLAETDISS